MNPFNVLAGAKTYILGGTTIVVGVLALFGWDLPGFAHVPAGVIIDGGLSIIFLRMGVNNAITKALEGVIGNLGK